MKFKVVSDNPISKEITKDAVMSGIREFLGTYGMAKAGITMVTENILRVAHTETDKVKTALSLIFKINGARAIVHTVYVSGSLEKAKSIGGA